MYYYKIEIKIPQYISIISVTKRKNGLHYEAN